MAKVDTISADGIKNTGRAANYHPILPSLGPPIMYKFIV